MVGKTTVDKVIAVLEQQPGLTGTEVAAAARIGRSTADKTLAELERQERAHRISPQGGKADRSQPARWSLAVGTPESPAFEGAAQNRPPDAAETQHNPLEPQAEEDVVNASQATAAELSEAEAPAAEGTPAMPVTVVDGDTAAADEGSERLRKGELRALVLAQLAADPDAEHSPSALGKLLNRSSGAIANALVRLTLEGLAVETSSRPRRYGAARRQAA